MATQHSLATYYNETPAILSLMSLFGDRFENLTAWEKFMLISLISLWQAVDTEAQAAGKVEITLQQALQSIAAHFYQETTSDAQRFLDILVQHNANEHEAIPLITALICQISEGVYQT
ncbi:hypothetical protein LEP3755_36000 [Leptolyngbya sp. NIES-3755]|nr:hypothetical protein LEP3755_36000 [Leptolyngbya sp. NIES-3755]